MLDPSLIESPTRPWYIRILLAAWNFLIGQHGFNLDAKARNRVGALLLVVAVAASWVTVRILAGWSALQPSPDEPAWELALQARLLLFRAKAALGLAFAVLGLSWLIFLVLDRTRLGKRLWHWDADRDSTDSSAAKTHVAGLIFAAILVVFGLLAAQVLR